MKTFTWSIFSPENEKLLREVKNLASLSDDDVCRIKNGVRDLNVALVHAEKNQEDIVPLVVGKKQPWASWPNAFAILGNLERTYAYTNVEVSKLLLTSTPLPLTGDITRRHASHKRSTVHPELISLFKDYVSSQNHSGNPNGLVVFSNMQKDGKAKVYELRGARKKLNSIRVKILAEFRGSLNPGDICLTSLTHEKERRLEVHGINKRDLKILTNIERLSQMIAEKVILTDVEHLKNDHNELASCFHSKELPRISYRPFCMVKNNKSHA